MLSLKNILCISLFTLSAVPSSYASQDSEDVDHEIGLGEYRRAHQSSNNQRGQRANPNINPELERMFAEATLHGALNGAAIIGQNEVVTQYVNSKSSRLQKLGESIEEGLYECVKGTTTQLTAQAITKCINFATQDPQLRINNNAISDFNRIQTRLNQLKSLQEESEDKEIIEGYELLIEQCKREIAQLLKNHLAQAKKQAKIAG